MFDLTAIFDAIANFFKFMLTLWKRSDAAKLDKLKKQLADTIKQIQTTTDDLKLNQLLELKKQLQAQIAEMEKGQET